MSLKKFETLFAAIKWLVFLSLTTLVIMVVVTIIFRFLISIL